MKRVLFILLAILPLTCIAKKKVVKPDVSISWLRVENMEKPMGIDTDKPRFSWIILSDKQNVKQTAYQIIVSTDKGEVWNSGRVESESKMSSRRPTRLSYPQTRAKYGTLVVWRVTSNYGYPMVAKN